MLHGVWRRRGDGPPAVAFPESKDRIIAVFLWRGGTLRELELASFHLLSHVGGEVIGESEGLKGMGMFETTAVGKEGHWEPAGAESQTAEL